MIDFLWPFYPPHWRKLMHKLKREGRFNEMAVKRLNNDFLYSFLLSAGLGSIVIVFSKIPSIYALYWCIFNYLTLGFAYRTDNFKRFYLYNSSEERKARIITPVKEGWHYLLGGSCFFKYEYKTRFGVQIAECLYRKRGAGRENFYSDFYEGAEILILVDKDDERISLVPMRNLEEMYKIDANRILGQGEK